MSVFIADNCKNTHTCVSCVTAVWKIALYTSAFLWACLFSVAKFSILEN